ncbi:MAG: hypothetical protein M3N28_06160 [Actinomycetota bacterium]|nr:hypothetical protein [Actinomycetota bacterium]
MRKLVLVVGALLLLLGLPSSGSAGVELTDPLNDVPRQFSSSPAQGGPGTTISFSGTGCPDELEVVVALYSGLPPVIDPDAVPALNLGTAVVTTTVTPDGDGRWSGSFVVPAGTPAGAYFVFADCAGSEAAGFSSASHDGLLGVVDYIPNAFLVLALPGGGGGGGGPSPTPGFDIGDLGAAVPIDGVPRFTG